MIKALSAKGKGKERRYLLYESYSHHRNFCFYNLVFITGPECSGIASKYPLTDNIYVPVRTWTWPVKWRRSRTAPESARKENSAATSRSFRSSFAKAIAFTALSRASAVNTRIFFYVLYSTLLHLPLLRDSTVSDDSGIEPRTVATSALAVREALTTKLDLISLRFCSYVVPKMTVRFMQCCADTGCFRPGSRVKNIPDPESRIRIRIKEFKCF
jgi:hypothetical protein